MSIYQIFLGSMKLTPIYIGNLHRDLCTRAWYLMICEQLIIESNYELLPTTVAWLSIIGSTGLIDVV